MEAVASEVLLPFHQSIIRAIASALIEDGEILFGLIMETKIPEGHDEIIEAIEKRWGVMEFWEDRVATVKASILAQKETALKSTGIQVLLPIGEIHFPTSHAPFWENHQLIKVLEEFGFKFSLSISPEGLRSAKLPDGWSTKGDAWVEGNKSSHRWWAVDEKGRRRIEVTKKIPWGNYDWAYFMTIERSFPGNDDPRTGW